LTPVRILLVGNEESLARLMKETSENLQWCDITTEPTSREASHALEVEKYDGVILHADMPEMDGFALTHKIRESRMNSSVPIVMLTDDNSIDLMRKGFKAGVTFFSMYPSSRQRVYTLFNSIRGVMVRERRRHVRLPLRLRVTCQWGEHGERQFVAESINIGEGGISMRPSGGMTIGQELDLAFVIPTAAEERPPSEKKVRRSIFTTGGDGEAERSMLRGIVRWQAPPDSMGIEFLRIPQAYQTYILRFISGAEGD
jgi:CheY-like chemotaxis protein